MLSRYGIFPARSRGGDFFLIDFGSKDGSLAAWRELNSMISGSKGEDVQFDG